MASHSSLCGLKASFGACRCEDSTVMGPCMTLQCSGCEAGTPAARKRCCPGAKRGTLSDYGAKLQMIQKHTVWFECRQCAGAVDAI